ncbi:MAG TPA: Ig-like domain-containing protein, partial [Candidatus Binatia bacterium]|nr:Ig-like domain-containing protein [Candidatus Binatia bacterium]
GVVEYAPEQDGAALNLAPGAQATIEIPIYAAKNLDGSLVAVGDTFPLWSLDPATGGWVREGTGIVVQSVTSPSGLALRGSVTHFSMWNHDSGIPPYNPKPKCLVDTNADGILEDLTGTGHCWHGGTGPEQPDDGFVATAQPADEIPAYFPNWVGQEVLPAQGGTILPVPSNMDIVLHSRALGGLLQGTKMIRGAAFVEEDVIVELHEVNPTGNHITIPFEADRTLSQDDSLHLYDFDGTAGQTVFVTVAEDGSSSTAADVFIIGPDDAELGPVEYRPTVNRPGRIGLVLPTTGNYRITVNMVPLASTGGYHITVDYTANFPIVLSNTPAANASGVATSVVPSVTFSQTISDFLSADIVGAEVTIPTTVDVTGAVVTITPSAPLVPGGGYRASVDGFRSPGASSPDGFPRTHEWTFNVAEIAGTLVPVGINRQGVAAVTADAAGNVYSVWSGYSFTTQNHEVRAARYAPGVGWSPPLQFNEAAFVGPFYGTSVAIVPGGAVTVFPRPSSGGQVSMVESRYTPAGGWTLPQQIEDVAGLFRDQPWLVADAAGNLIALFGTTGVENDVYWSRYTVATDTWTAPAILFEDARTAHLATNDDGVAVAIADQVGAGDQALVRRFVPGVGWSAVEPFESDVAGFRGGVDDAGNVFVLLAPSTGHVVRRFDVDTQAWSAPLNVQSAATCGVNVRLAVAADGHAIVTGCTSTSPGPGIFAAHYTPDAGAGTWAPSVALSAGPSGLHDLGMDASGNAVAIWNSAADSSIGQYRRYSTATGWEASVHDFPAVANIYDMHLAVGGNGVAVVVIDGYSVGRAYGVRLP